MIRLVILDVEGVITLPGGSEHPWPLEDMVRVRDLLQQLAAGCGLCTGRQEPYGEAVIQALSLFKPLSEDVAANLSRATGRTWLSWPSIMENGAYFYDPLAKTPVPHPELTPARIEALQRLRTERLTPLARRTGALIEAGKDFSLSINPPLLSPDSAARVRCDEFRPLVDQVCAEFLDSLEVKHSHSAIDVTPRGISKASAVQLLLEWTGLTPEEVLGVGDTRADEQWLQVVGRRAAPANGREQLPGMEYYAQSEVATGLFEILEHFRCEMALQPGK